MLLASVVFVLASSLKSNPIKSSLNLKFEVYKSIFLPSGWSFFTRNPREEWLYAYTLSDNGDFEEYFFEASSRKNLFGLSKKFKVIRIEMNTILNELKLKDEQWYKCEGRVEDCYDHLKTNRILDNYTFIAVNRFNYPRACGLFVLNMKEPIPWAWSKNESIQSPSSRIILLNIYCN